MECEQIQRLLLDYFDGALDSVVEDVIEDHLSVCVECAKSYEDMEAVIAVLRLTSKPLSLPSEEFYKKAFSKSISLSSERKAAGGAITVTEPGFVLRLLRDFWKSPSLGMNLARAAVFMFVGILGVLSTPHFIERPGVDSRSPVGDQVSLTRKDRAAIFQEEKREIAGVFETPVAIAAEQVKAPAAVGHSVIDKSHKSVLEAALEEAEKIQSPPSSAMTAKSGQIDLVDGELFYTVPPPPGAAERGGHQILLVATRDRQLDVIESIQKLKMNLHLSGESRFIPEVHKIERYIADIAEATERTDSSYLTNLKVFQEAEQCLVEKKYVCALQNYDEVAKESPGSLMSFLALFQTANVNYEQLRDYRAALAQYQMCLEQYPAQYITDEKKDIILNRIDILTRNSTDDWRPLHLYMKSKTASTSVAIPMLKEILDRYPASSLILETIEALSAKIVQDEDSETGSAEDVISFFQQCRERYEARHIRQTLQFKTAEIFQYRLMNARQAILEYTRAVEIDPQSKLAERAKNKIHTLYRRGVSLR